MEKFPDNQETRTTNRPATRIMDLTGVMRSLRQIKKLFPSSSIETIKVKMLYTKEISRFIKKVEKAHKLTAKSKQVFK